MARNTASLLSIGAIKNTFRYFGNNYPRLLKIKKYWDPENVINHCHSVGSTEQECCVEDG